MSSFFFFKDSLDPDIEHAINLDYVQRLEYPVSHGLDSYKLLIIMKDKTSFSLMFKERSDMIGFVSRALPVQRYE